VQAKGGRIVLTPVRIQPADAIGARLVELQVEFMRIKYFPGEKAVSLTSRRKISARMAPLQPECKR